MIVLDISGLVLTLAGVVLLAMALIFLAQVAASFLPGRRPGPSAPPEGARFAVLVPAHNEALGIGRTLSSIFPELSDRDRLVVIADNCTDETGLIAQRAGAEVFTRDDPHRRGKGYALDFAVRRLAADAPDAVIFVDADCVVAPGALRAIAAECLSRQRPVQARYDMDFPATGAGNLAVASFAWEVKNYVRPLGLRRLGLPCQLMGTGMAFPWGVISRADLATGNIVEDMALGLDLAAARAAPVFYPAARVSSDFPVSSEGQQTQRTRWETGHLHTIGRVVPRLLWQGITRANRDLAVLAADAAVPPLTFLCLSIGAALAVSAMLYALGGSALPLLLTVFAGFAVTLSVFLAAWQIRKSAVSLTGLRLIAKYALSKFVIYANAMSGKRVEWIRSKRD